MERVAVQPMPIAAPARGFSGVFASLLIACGAGDAGLPGPAADAAAGPGPSALDAQVVDAGSGALRDAASGALRDAADPLGSSSADRDAETTIALCGAQPDSRCTEDAGLADARAAAVPNRCDGGAEACTDVSCDVRQVLCKRAPPVCAEGEVPAVIDTCYGDCVQLEQCVCHAPAECPMSDRYTCHQSAAHCGPYVN